MILQARTSVLPPRVDLATPRPHPPSFFRFGFETYRIFQLLPPSPEVSEIEDENQSRSELETLQTQQRRSCLPDDLPSLSDLLSPLITFSTINASIKVPLLSRSSIERRGIKDAENKSFATRPNRRRGSFARVDSSFESFERSI